MPTPTPTDDPTRLATAPAPRGRPRLVAAGFIFAFGLSIVTVVLTGLWVRSPERRTAEPPAPAAVESRDIHAAPEEKQGVGSQADPTPADETSGQ